MLVPMNCPMLRTVYTNIGFGDYDMTFYCNGKRTNLSSCPRCIWGRLNDHYEEAKTLFNEDRIVGLFLQGSQNYGLDIPGSDVDTKLIVTPTFKEIAMNIKPVSTTHVRANEEHIDLKDIRLYFQTFVKQNLNFLEILFTDYKIVNKEYEELWNILVSHREEIAHMNPHRAVKSMKGMALEKYHAMKHPYPSKISILEKYGYDGKQVHHLLRIEDYLKRYIDGESYEKCLIPSKNIKQHLLDYKLQLIPLKEAEEEARISINNVIKMSDDFCNLISNNENEEVKEFMNNILYNIMKISINLEF